MSNCQNNTVAVSTKSAISSALVLLGDMVSFVGAFFLAGWLAQALRLIVIPGYMYGPLSRPEVVLTRGIVFAVIAASIMLWLASHNHYRQRHSSSHELREIVIACVIAALVDAALQFSAKENVSRLWLTRGWMAAALILPLTRYIVRRTLNISGLWQIPVHALGSDEQSELIRRAFSADAALGYAVTANSPLTNFERLPDETTKQHDERLLLELERLGVGRGIRLVMAPQHHELGIVESLVTVLDRQQYRYAIAAPLQGIPLHGLEQQYFLGQNLLLLTTSNNLQRPFNRAVKRGFDMLTSILALIALSPAILGLALVIKMDGGPAFFGHTRIGAGGSKFKCWKLRTMVPNADKALRDLLEADLQARREWEQDFKLREDPRITWLGGFLRVSGLDELPQLFNVVLGQMSLVGPRPIVDDEVDRYGANMAAYFAVRPGITGLWQVSGRNDVDYDTRVAFDLWYAKNWSLWLDFTIMLKTIPAVLARRGAY